MKISSPTPFGTPAVVLSSAVAAGSSGEALRTDDTIIAFDGTSPSTQAFGDSATVGSAVVATRRDHKHAMPADPTVSAASAAEVLAKSSNTVFITPGRAEYHPYMPKAGGRCESSGTVQDGSFGVSGITRSTSPHIYYKWNFDPDFSNTDYFALVCNNSGNSTNRDVWVCGPSSMGTTGFNVESWNDGDGAYVDAEMSMIAWGTIP